MLIGLCATYLGSACALSSCEKPVYHGPARGYSCRCDALTDTDVPRTVDVNICARYDSQADTVAKGCAQKETQLLVTKCKCGAGKNCELDWCGAK